MKGRIEIDRELCKGCNYCVLACPKGILAMSGDFNKSGFFPALVLDMDKCTGCALCAVVCPEIAIEVWQEKRAGSRKE
jgi:2-oxoglutarate ferredoxin oxidoreductase subunit delta